MYLERVGLMESVYSIPGAVATWFRQTPRGEPLEAEAIKRDPDDDQPSTPQTPQTPQTPHAISLAIPEQAATSSAGASGNPTTGVYYGAPNDLSSYTMADVLNVCTGGRLFDAEDALYNWSDNEQ